MSQRRAIWFCKDGQVAERGKVRVRKNVGSIGQETRRMSAMLLQQILALPDVSERSMFGMRALYRDGVIFAMLPDKRLVEGPNTIAVKLPSKAPESGKRWRLFDILREDDINAAISLLVRAHKEAKAA